MPEHQGPRRYAACQIIVHGMQDVTSRLHPYLISVQVIDKDAGIDEAHIELDDRNAELIIPPDRTAITIALGWSGEGPRLFDSGRRSATGGQGPIPMSIEEALQEARFGGPGLRVVFHGEVDEVESGFGRRGGGRRMWIGCKGVAGKGPAKETQQGHAGEGKPEDGQEGKKVPLKEMMTKVFGSAGMNIAMSPEMEKIARDYWSWNDSPMNLGKRMADELGGVFKISGGNQGSLVSATGGVNVEGTAMPTIEAVWGVNLIGWRIKPFVSRPQYSSAQAKFFDLSKGAYETVKGLIGNSGAPFGGANAIANAVNSVVDKAQGEQSNKGAEAQSQVNAGLGWVLINGEPNAKAMGNISIEGARPGIDGTYQITEVEHNYTRGVGYTTRCRVVRPKASGGFETWKKGDPLPEPGDPGFIGPNPWPDVPTQEEVTFTAIELGAFAGSELLREQSIKARADGKIPITRDELGSDGKVPEGYVLVGPSGRDE